MNLGSGTGVPPVRFSSHRRDACATTAAPVRGFKARNSFREISPGQHYTLEQPTDLTIWTPVPPASEPPRPWDGENNSCRYRYGGQWLPPFWGGVLVVLEKWLAVFSVSTSLAFRLNGNRAAQCRWATVSRGFFNVAAFAPPFHSQALQSSAELSPVSANDSRISPFPAAIACRPTQALPFPRRSGDELARVWEYCLKGTKTRAPAHNP